MKRSVPAIIPMAAITMLSFAIMQCKRDGSLSTEDLKKIEAARQHYSARKFEEAKAILDPLLKERPESVEVAVLLARVFFFTRDFKSSEETLRRVQKHNAGSPYVLLWLGKVIASDASRQNEAAEIFRSILRQDPENYVAHYHLGRCLEAQGKLEQALLEYERASAVEFQMSKLHLHMGELFTRLSMKDRAREHFRRVEQLNLYPDDVRAVRKIEGKN